MSNTPDGLGERGGAHLGILVLRIVLAVDVAGRRLVRDAERGVADLRREVVLEVEEARLAYVARLGAGLADHGRLEAHACAWVPAEDGERARARPAFPSELLLGLFSIKKVSIRRYSEKKRCAHHPDERVVPQAFGKFWVRNAPRLARWEKLRRTCLAKDGKFALLPTGLVNVCFGWHSEGERWGYKQKRLQDRHCLLVPKLVYSWMTQPKTLTSKCSSGMLRDYD